MFVRQWIGVYPKLGAKGAAPGGFSVQDSHVSGRGGHRIDVERGVGWAAREEKEKRAWLGNERN